VILRSVVLKWNPLIQASIIDQLVRLFNGPQQREVERLAAETLGDAMTGWSQMRGPGGLTRLRSVHKRGDPP
jgi:hypothetical protein